MTDVCPENDRGKETLVTWKSRLPSASPHVPPDFIYLFKKTYAAFIREDGLNDLLSNILSNIEAKSGVTHIPELEVVPISDGARSDPILRYLLVGGSPPTTSEILDYYEIDAHDYLQGLPFVDMCFLLRQVTRPATLTQEYNTRYDLTKVFSDFMESKGVTSLSEHIMNVQLNMFIQGSGQANSGALQLSDIILSAIDATLSSNSKAILLSYVRLWNQGFRWDAMILLSINYPTSPVTAAIRKEVLEHSIQRSAVANLIRHVKNVSESSEGGSFFKMSSASSTIPPVHFYRALKMDIIKNEMDPGLNAETNSSERLLVKLRNRKSFAFNLRALLLRCIAEGDTKASLAIYKDAIQFMSTADMLVCRTEVFPEMHCVIYERFLSMLGDVVEVIMHVLNRFSTKCKYYEEDSKGLLGNLVLSWQSSGYLGAAAQCEDVIQEMIHTFINIVVNAKSNGSLDMSNKRTLVLTLNFLLVCFSQESSNTFDEWMDSAGLNSAVKEDEDTRRQLHQRLRRKIVTTNGHPDPNVNAVLYRIKMMLESCSRSPIKMHFPPPVANARGQQQQPDISHGQGYSNSNLAVDTRDGQVPVLPLSHQQDHRQHGYGGLPPKGRRQEPNSNTNHVVFDAATLTKLMSSQLLGPAQPQNNTSVTRRTTTSSSQERARVACEAGSLARTSSTEHGLAALKGAHTASGRKGDNKTAVVHSVSNVVVPNSQAEFDAFMMRNPAPQVAQYLQDVIMTDSLKNYEHADMRNIKEEPALCAPSPSEDVHVHPLVDHSRATLDHSRATPSKNVSDALLTTEQPQHEAAPSAPALTQAISVLSQPTDDDKIVSDEQIADGNASEMALRTQWENGTNSGQVAEQAKVLSESGAGASELGSEEEERSLHASRSVTPYEDARRTESPFYDCDGTPEVTLHNSDITSAGTEEEQQKPAVVVEGAPETMMAAVVEEKCDSAETEPTQISDSTESIAQEPEHPKGVYGLEGPFVRKSADWSSVPRLVPVATLDSDMSLDDDMDFTVATQKPADVSEAAKTTSTIAEVLPIVEPERYVDGGDVMAEASPSAVVVVDRVTESQESGIDLMSEGSTEISEEQQPSVNNCGQQQEQPQPITVATEDVTSAPAGAPSESTQPVTVEPLVSESVSSEMLPAAPSQGFVSIGEFNKQTSELNGASVDCSEAPLETLLQTKPVAIPDLTDGEAELMGILASVSFDQKNDQLNNVNESTELDQADNGASSSASVVIDCTSSASRSEEFLSNQLAAQSAVPVIVEDSSLLATEKADEKESQSEQTLSCPTPVNADRGNVIIASPVDGSVKTETDAAPANQPVPEVVQPPCYVVPRDKENVTVVDSAPVVSAAGDNPSDANNEATVSTVEITDKQIGDSENSAPKSPEKLKEIATKLLDAVPIVEHTHSTPVFVSHVVSKPAQPVAAAEPAKEQASVTATSTAPPSPQFDFGGFEDCQPAASNFGCFGGSFAGEGGHNNGGGDARGGHRGRGGGDRGGRGGGFRGGNRGGGGRGNFAGNRY